MFTSSPSPSSAQRTTTITLAVLGVFVTYVPITGVSVSLAAIGTATHASYSDLQWVSDAYVIPMAAAVLSAGVFGDLHGRRRMFSLGMLLTLIGSVVAGVSNAVGNHGSIGLLWGGQAIAGIGAGILLPTTLALIATAVPNPKERGRYIGMWATGMVGGLALGPLLSGLILEVASWGWLYAPIVVLAAITLIVAHLRLPESTSPEGRHLDWPGQISATIAIAASIYGVISGGEHGWSSARSIAGIATGVVALVIFCLLQHRTERPLMRLGLFRSAPFTAAAVAALIALFSIVGSMFLLSLFLGQVQHLSPLQIGLRLLFVTGVSVVLNPFVGRLMQRVAPMLLLIIGLVIAAIGLFLLTGLHQDTSFADLVWRLAVFGVSFAFMLTAVTVVAINSAPWPLAGMASATVTAFRQFGGALGPAILGSVAVSSGRSATAGFTSALYVCIALLMASTVLCVFSVIRRRAVSPQ